MKSRTSTGTLYLLTLTAPGLPGHQEFIPGRPGQHGVCSHRCWESGMHSGVFDLARWNAGAAGFWNRMRTALCRDVAGLVFARCVEVQKRGAIHYHIVVWSPEPLAPQRIRDLALSAGFGCNVDLKPITSEAGRAARYIAKYVSKAVDDRDVVPWMALVDEIDYGTGEITREWRHTTATYRALSYSQAWGVTMKQLRAEAAAAVAASRAARGLVVQVLDDPAPANPAGLPAPPGL